jgi:hypothetical protein
MQKRIAAAATGDILCLLREIKMGIPASMGKQTDSTAGRSGGAGNAKTGRDDRELSAPAS